MGTDVDLYLDWHSGADNDLITDAIAAGSCRPTSPTDVPQAYPGTTLTKMRIEADAASPVQGLVTCGGLEYDIGDTVQGAIYNHDDAAYEDSVMANVSSAPSVMSMGLMYRTNIDLEYAYWAPWGMFGTGNWAALGQRYLSGEMRLFIHTNQGYSANYVAIALNTWYWVTIQYNATTGVGSLAVYDPATWTQVGSTVTLGFGATRPPVAYWQVGGAENQGNQDAANTWYGPCAFDWTDGTFPLLPEAPPSGYTLACDGGSYGLTGQEAGTLKGSKVTAEAGAIVVTGQDAGTFYGRKVEAEAGTYVLSGIDLALLRAAKIVAEAGAIALTGMDAATLFGRVLGAEPGVYNYKSPGPPIGTEVTLLRAASLAAEAGAYAMTGQDVALLRAAIIAAESGSYVLVGQDATLVYVPGGGAYILTAEGGTYAITGMSADVLKSSRLAADPGAYVLTGVDAATLIGRLIDAGAGAYAISGLDAELLRTAKLAAEAGAYVVTGEDASLSASVAVLVALLEMLRPSPRIVLSPAVKRIVTLSPSPRIVQTTRSEP